MRILAACGVAPHAHLLLFLVSGTAVAAFDAVGAVLFVAFVIVPPATAYLLTDRLLAMVLLGVAVSAASTVVPTVARWCSGKTYLSMNDLPGRSGTTGLRVMAWCSICPPGRSSCMACLK